MLRLSAEKCAFARALRNNSTDAERALWRALHAEPFSDVKFRRQHPVGRYVLDFASLPNRLVIEVDGGQHAECETDPVRDKWLQADGWRVLRFWNHDVMGNLDGVLTVIAAAIWGEFRPPPQPSPCPGAGGMSER